MLILALLVYSAYGHLTLEKSVLGVRPSTLNGPVVHKRSVNWVRANDHSDLGGLGRGGLLLRKISVEEKMEEKAMEDLEQPVFNVEGLEMTLSQQATIEKLQAEEMAREVDASLCTIDEHVSRPSMNPLLDCGTIDDIFFDRVTKPTYGEVLRYVRDNTHLSDSRALMGKITNGSGPLRPKTKPMNLLHVSRSAGSLLCSCALESGKSNPTTTRLGLPSAGPNPINCHDLEQDDPFWGFHDVPVWAMQYPNKTDDCGALEDLYKARGITFEANENFQPNDGALCSNFENVIIMRSPIHRIASHVQLVCSKTTKEGKNKKLSKTDECAKQFRVHELLEKWPYLTNNMYARSIGGKHLFDLSPVDFQKQAASLEDGLIDKLRRFDSVFVIGKELNAELEYVYGWNCTQVLGRKSSVSGGTQAIVDHWSSSWPEEDMKLLEDYNAVDAKLFKEAQMISSLRASQMAHAQ